jgi:hypothetical protein
MTPPFAKFPRRAHHLNPCVLRRFAAIEQALTSDR